MLRRAAARIARLQALIAAVVSGLWAVFAGPSAGFGALVGGAIGLLLTLYAAAQLLGRPAQSPHDALGAMIRAEVGKFILATVSITLAVMALPQQAAAIVTTLAATLSAYWLALLYTNE